MAPASAQGPFCLTPDDRRHELVLCPVCRRVSMPCIISAASLLPIARLYERNIRRGHDFVRADPREDGAMAGLYVICAGIVGFIGLGMFLNRTAGVPHVPVGLAERIADYPGAAMVLGRAA